jgi:hypothetical protein
MHKHNNLLLTKNKNLTGDAGLMVVYYYIINRKMKRKWVENRLARRDLFGHITLIYELSENESNDIAC